MAAPKERLRILYLEDDPADVELTLWHVARYAPHLEFIVASSGQEALDRVGREAFDALLLDVRVPDRTGLEVLQEITRRGLALPALMVTAAGDIETAIQALKAGAFDYVVKKAGYLATLPAAIEGAMARFRERADLGTRHATRVLYVEPTSAHAESTLRHFGTHAPHFAFDTARTGRGALRRLAAGGLDLVLLDCKLPDIDSIEVLKEMQERGIAIPVVVVTDRDDEETAVQALKLGALDYVVKRGEYVEHLPSTLTNALIRHRLAGEREALRVLNGLAGAVASSLELGDLFRQVAEAACTLLKVDQCLLGRLADDGVTLQPAAWRGMPDAAAQGLVFRMGEGLPGQAALHRRPVEARGLEAEPQAALGAEGEAPFTPALSVPLVSGECLLGVLSVAGPAPRGFSAMNRALLAGLAAHAAIAIQNARLYQDLKRSSEDLRRSQDILVRQEKMAALGHLAWGLAHELNSPLAAIAGFAEMLQVKAQAPALAGIPALAEFPEKLKHIIEQAFRCGNLVHRLLTYARQPEPQCRPLDLWAVVEDSLALMAGRVRRLGEGFESVRGTGKLTVLADPSLLQQVAINLLTNALDAVEDGGTVRVAASRDEPPAGQAVILLVVADTGIGIAPDALPRLFDPFFTTKGERGTGLGLPICRTIVERHGGTLEVQSAGPGRGATATVRLPAVA